MPHDGSDHGRRGVFPQGTNLEDWEKELDNLLRDPSSLESVFSFSEVLGDPFGDVVKQDKLSRLLPIAQRLSQGVSGGYGPKTKFHHSAGDTHDDRSKQIIQLLLRSLGSQKPIQPSVLPLEIGPESVTQEAHQDATAQEQVSRLFR